MSFGLLLLLFLVVGVGNYLMRFLPLLISLRRRGRAGRRTGGSLLPLVGPAVVAALLAVSLLPEGPAASRDAELLRSAAALVPTLLVALRFGNIGLTVLTGVVAYALVSLVV